MTDEELADVRARATELRKRRGAANKELERIKLEFRLLRMDCTHPNSFRTSHLGENCTHCPDCIGGCLS